MPELEAREVRRGSSGANFVRVERRNHSLTQTSDTTLEATRQAHAARTAAGRIIQSVRRVLIGAPLATSAVIHERLTKVKALAIFSSDALSSSAYATEEILLVLVIAGSGALAWSIPIAAAIVGMMLLVTVSYRQTVRAYPNGGGAYIVGRENLGETAGTVAASALLVDYVLTVAVSVAAGVAAITSAIPEAEAYRVELAVGFVAFVTVINLRGIRESGTIFAVPTYFFLLCFLGMLGVGLGRVLLGLGPVEGVDGEASAVSGSLTLFLILRAFSSGSSALTGIEAISNGVPAFKAPESKNAATTLAWMSALLAVLFLGLTILAHEFDIVPGEDKTVVSQVATATFGSSIFFYAVQASTAMILILAANTAFADFPRLSSILARDGYLPRRFTFRGDRLAFTNGILALGVLASVLLVAYGAETHSLIPLYAVGVFVSFTISQAGMVVHWLRDRQGQWRRSIAINAVGALATGVVAVVITATKFLDGAWLTLVAIGGIIVLLRLIARSYAGFENSLAPVSRGLPVSERNLSAQRVIVPVSKVNRAAVWTVEYALSISPHVTAVHVKADDEQVEDLLTDWRVHMGDVPLVVIESPYRAFLEPFLAYLDALGSDSPLTVAIPGFVTRHWWENLLHNNTASTLKRALKRRKYTVVVDVPWLVAEKGIQPPET
ncbi:MAG: APC family permease [Dehalococcoidia bacterium]